MLVDLAFVAIPVASRREGFAAEKMFVNSG
jgi:hypothetical protein